MPRSRLPKVDSVIDTVLRLSELQDHRAVAIMAAAFLEYTLGLALSARLREMDPSEQSSVFDNQGHGALATFSQKIWMGFALGLYLTDARSDLSRIKEVRNRFAHVPEHVDFSDQEIAGLCAKLSAPKLLAERSMKPEQMGPRERYLDSVHFFASGFHLAGKHHVHRPPPPPDMFRF